MIIPSNQLIEITVLNKLWNRSKAFFMCVLCLFSQCPLMSLSTHTHSIQAVFFTFSGFRTQAIRFYRFTSISHFGERRFLAKGVSWRINLSHLLSRITTHRVQPIRTQDYRFSSTVPIRCSIILASQFLETLFWFPFYRSLRVVC